MQPDVRGPGLPLLLRPVVQGEDGARLDRLAALVRRREGDAAVEQGAQRLDVDRRAAEQAELRVDAAGVPEHRVGPDQRGEVPPDRDPQIDRGGLGVQADLDHLADLELPIEDRIAGLDRAQVGRLEDQKQVAGADRRLRGFTLQQGEGRPRLRRGARVPRVRKADAAREQALQGLHLQTGVEEVAHVEGDAAGVPEPGVLAHQFVVRVVNDDLDGQGRIVFGQGVVQHLADGDTAVDHRRAAVQRAETVGLEHELAVPFVALFDGRFVQAFEAEGRRAAARTEGDVVPRDQGVQAGDPANADLGAHDPEAYAVVQVRLHFLLEGRVDDHLREVVGRADIVHEARLEALEEDLGLAGLEPVGGLEGDGDRGSLIADRRERQPAADQGRAERDQPHDRYSTVPLVLDPWKAGLGRLFSIRVTHGPGPPPVSPKSVAGRTTWPRRS